MNKLRLLVVDDDDLVLQSIKIASPDNWHVTCCNDHTDVPQGNFHAAMIDMHLTGDTSRAEGVDLIAELGKKYPHLEIVAMSGDLNRDLMESCLKAGATRFLAKPLSADEINLTLGKIEALFLLQGAIGRPQAQTWAGTGKESSELKKKLAGLAGEPGPILLEGESGTGKEVVAHLTHAQEQNGGPFVAVNIAAIPENLFESELFGHNKGSFTGATQNKMGLAEAAHGGHLFLDEIEALPLNQQVKLLRFLETGEVRRVGSQNPIKVEARVIVATNRNLEDMVKQGEFREDLLWRLNGKKITLPTLRNRIEDIGELAKHFISLDPCRKKELSDEAIAALAKHNWPGNVRELKRVCEQLLSGAPLPVIREEDVDKFLRPKPSQSSSSAELDYSLGLPKLVADFEAKIISDCISQQKDVEEVARTLKVSRSSLYKKIKDHGIEWRDS